MSEAPAYLAAQSVLASLPLIGRKLVAFMRHNARMDGAGL